MNPRIQELAQRADGNPNYRAFRGHFLPPPPDYIDPATVDLEKFAELIVRECMHVIKQNEGASLNISNFTDEKQQGIQLGLEFAICDIAEHFGVE